MIIFLDESGGFIGNFGASSLSLVGSMTVMDSKLDEVLEKSYEQSHAHQAR